jgi:hypothetical protein
MAGDSWLACRASEALRIRRSLAAAGAILGFLSALVPSGFAVYPGGAGLFGGIGAAWAGSAAVAPLILPFLVSSAVGKEDDSRITVAYFLSGVAPARFRGGACGVAFLQWGVLVAGAVVAGAFTGLGDGLRMSDPFGEVGRLFLPLLALTATSTYMFALASGIAVNASGRLRGLAANYGLIVIFFVLLAFGPQSAVAGIAHFSPLAPLWSALPVEVTGRFTISVTTEEMFIVAACWTIVAVAAFFRSVRRGGLSSLA